MNDPVETKIPIADAIQEFQRLFDRNDLTQGVNLCTKIATCEEQLPDGGSCSHQAIVQSAEVVACEACGKKSKDVELRRCLLHYLKLVDRYIDPQTGLFDADDGDDRAIPADRAAQAADADEAARKLAEKRADAKNDIVVDGKSGAFHVEFSEDPDAPGMCGCGWEIASEAPRELHDRRHLEWRKKTGRYVEDENPKVADVTAARGRRVKAGSNA